MILIILRYIIEVNLYKKESIFKKKKNLLYLK
jgi:hypothetical protein